MKKLLILIPLLLVAATNRVEMESFYIADANSGVFYLRLDYGSNASPFPEGTSNTCRFGGWISLRDKGTYLTYYPSNVIITTTHEPIVVMTNGGWTITFKEKK